MSWQLYSRSNTEWDRVIARHCPQSPFQGSAWARFRQIEGWQPFRFILEEEQAAIQLLVKRKLGFPAICWSAGGLLGTCTSQNLSELPMVLRESLGSRVTYLRISDLRVAVAEHVSMYADAGWQKCSRPLATNDTLVRYLSEDPVQLRDAYSKNWSRNLRRGEQRNIRFETWMSPDYTLMAQMYQEVADRKGSFKADWRASPERLSDFAASFGNSLCIVRALSPDGTTLSYRAAINLGTLAFDILAATTNDGRKNYASHVATHGLLTTLGSSGCSRYDFGGVDNQRNTGVYNFKHGAGGRTHRYCGEWHHSYPGFALRVIERLINASITSGRS